MEDRCALKFSCSRLGVVEITTMPAHTNRQPRGFRTELTVWFGGLALFVLLCAGYYLGRLATHDLVQLQGEKLYGLSRATANQLGNSLQEREQEIWQLSQAPHFTRGDFSHPDVYQSLQRRLQARAEYAWLGVADPQGTVLRATGGLLEGADVFGRTWHLAGRHGLFVGDVHEAVLLAQLIPRALPVGESLRFIDFAAPVRNPQGELLGVLGLHVHWDWVTQVAQRPLQGHALGAGVEMLILDRDSRVIHPQTLSALQADPSWQTMDRPAMVDWPDGQRYLTSVVPVPPTASTQLGWQIVLRQPAAIAAGPANELRNQLVLLGAGASALFAWLAYRIARRISRPLEQLTRTVQSVEAGERAPVFPQNADILEIAHLSQSLNAMTQNLLRHESELERQNVELEQRVAERTEALRAANEELARHATIDALTAVANRRRFEERLHEAWLLYQRSKRTYALMLLDVDHFKAVNDTHGHQGGDAVLQHFAALLQNGVRATDFVARYGGEEFVVLLPDTPDAETALRVAEKIRLAVDQAAFPVVQHLTVSIGLSLCQAHDGHAHTCIERADQALYQAKREGRNRVVLT